MYSKKRWLVSASVLVLSLAAGAPGAAAQESTAPLPLVFGAELPQQRAAEQDPDGSLAQGSDEEPEESGEGAADDSEPDDGKTRAGPFVLDAGAAVSQGYTDNVYATRNDKVGDGLNIFTPEVSLTSEGLPVDLEFFGSAEIGRYWDETSEDYEDFDFGLEATHRIAPQSAVFGGASFGRDHEERDSPDDVNGSEPTLFYDTQAFIGTANRIDDVTLRAGATFERLDYSDVDSDSGSINNDDRDRNLYTAGARVGYIVAPGYEVFGQGLFDLRDYDDARDNSGFDRDSKGFSAGAGLHYRPDPTLDVEGFLGLLSQDYDDSDFDTTTEPDFGLQVTWRPQSGTRIRGFVDRSLQETTLIGSSGYVSTAYGVSLIQQIRPDIRFETSAAFYESDYKGLDREDTTVDLGIGGRYYLTPNFFLATNYSFLQRDSVVASEDYDEHQVFFTLGAELSPAYQEEEEALAAAPPVVADLGGLYAGVQGGLSNLGTALAGPRGGGGSQTAEFADLGLSGGVFTGYALRAGDWQFGLEVDAELSDADWAHSRDMGGRTFSVEKEWSVAAGPVVGYWLNDDSMIYTRFGVVQSGFDTDYIESGNSYGESQDLTGLRVGLGAETTLTGNFFLRLDYSYTDYEDYDISFGSGSDNFANNESLVRLGLGYRFPGGAEDSAPAEAEAPDLAGFYVGAGGGQNRLNSENHGDRQAGSVLEVDAGEGGASGGVFAGYGVVWQDIYLGGEVEAELSEVTWEREREPTGRQFEIDKEGGIGAALRAGYVLPGGALAYGRVGVMYSKFNTEVTTTGNHFEEDEFLLGLRVGGGLELPISEDFFARLEYSYTAYEDASLATGSGPEDFEHSEGLFRAAVGFRF